MQDVRIAPEAAIELEEAAVWYENEQAGLGARLLDAFERAVQLLREPNAPLTPVEGMAGELRAKKLILHKFPFSIIVKELGNCLVVVSLAHHSRKPGYWRARADP